MDKRLTVHDVMALRPCPDYGHERVKTLWAGRESLSPLEVLDPDIPIEDRLWCVLRPEMIGGRTKPAELRWFIDDESEEDWDDEGRDRRWKGYVAWLPEALAFDGCGDLVFGAAPRKS
jgi:hypothetical protein